MSTPESYEIDISQKLVNIAAKLTEHDIPYAFGGAIAFGYHGEPRGTIDLDINIFIPPNENRQVINAFNELFPVDDAEALAEQVKNNDQLKTHWGDTRLDLFFLSDTDFHQSMSTRTQEVPFGNTAIRIISVEDLIVCKALFSRPKDWIDISKLCAVKADKIDYNYVKTWLSYFLGPDSPNQQQFDGIATGAS
jgi:hypothetical protein